ncbi:TPA: hypothetical protein HA242_02745 [Candidatus Woesearchaeota archaeon]|nr:hypothetical protein [Candidatus Woesearchaeota archaeon]HIG93760.1 hypothetical protein [Candidatus Woesearchaeota archaeon]HIH12617.1 hypothetical protein [Candidatus Woesearchaeota archaeon]
MLSIEKYVLAGDGIMADAENIKVVVISDLERRILSLPPEKAYHPHVQDFFVGPGEYLAEKTFPTDLFRPEPRSQQKRRELSQQDSDMFQRIILDAQSAYVIGCVLNSYDSGAEGILFTYQLRQQDTGWVIQQVEEIGPFVQINCPPGVPLNSPFQLNNPTVPSEALAYLCASFPRDS